MTTIGTKTSDELTSTNLEDKLGQLVARTRSLPGERQKAVLQAWEVMLDVAARAALR